jgi:hypothetical protein
MSLGDMGGASSGNNRGGAAGTNRYCDEKKEWRTRGFSLEVIMDHREVPALLVELSNAAGWPINILRVHVADSSDGDLIPSEGASGNNMMTRSMMPSGPGRSGPGAIPPGPAGGHAARGGPPGATPMPMSRPTSSRRNDRDTESAPSSNAPSAHDDPNLAKVSIVGVIYIFMKPPELPATPAPSQTPAGVPPTPVAAAPADAAATTEPAAGSDEPGAERDADEKPESKTDESNDESSAAAPDGSADSKPKPDAEGKPGPGDSR